MLLSAPLTFRFILPKEHEEQGKNNKNTRTQRLVKQKRVERRFPLDDLAPHSLLIFLLFPLANNDDLWVLIFRS
jgi:hypothetical protein